MSRAVVWLVFAIAIGIAGCSADDVTETQSEVGTATVEPSVSTEPTVTASPASTASPAPTDEQEPTTTQTVGNAGDDAAVLDPLTLTEAQLDELSPSPELVAAAMGAAEVEEDRRGFGVGVDLPSDAVVAERIYWSMDGGVTTSIAEAVFGEAAQISGQ